MPDAASFSTALHAWGTIPEYMTDVVDYPLLLNVAATLMMTGVIWFVQVVHYPLMEQVGASGFVTYEKLHTRWTTYVVAPPMLVEAATALARDLAMHVAAADPSPVSVDRDGVPTGSPTSYSEIPRGCCIIR